MTISTASQVEAEVTSLEEVEDAVTDFQITLEARVKNTGETSLDRDCSVKFWVRGPGTNRYVGSANIETSDGDLGEGERRWYQIGWTPTNSGEYQYWAIVWCNGFTISDWSDPEGFTVEKNTAEAEVIDIEEIDETIQGTQINLEARIRNTGDIDIKEGCRVWFYVRSAFVNGFVGSERMDDELEPNERRWFSLGWTPKYPGYYKYWARVYCASKPISNWSDGEIFHVQRGVRSAGVIDTLSQQTKLNNITTLWASIRNDGNQVIGPECNADFWLRGQGINKYLGAVPLDLEGVLYPGDQRWLGMQWNASKAGEYKYWARISCDRVSIGAWYPQGGELLSVVS